MSKPTPQYVQRALGRIVGEARTEAINGVTAIQRRNSAAGRLDSGNTLVDSNEAMLALMKAMMKRGAETTFNAFEEVTDGGVRLLMNFGQALAKTVAAPVIEWAEADKGGPSAGIKAKMADELQERLRRMLNDELDDFSHGMHGGARLKKEPVVNSIINNTMNNSPGAVQQAGVGKFSQSAFTQQTAHLTQAIDAFLASPEFQQLAPEQKDAVADVADALKHEAAQSEPNPGKLRRWGERLSGLTKEFGLHVAASGVWHALGAIFPGAVF